MPPPKKPKIGRTSLEQFLSEEERGSNSIPPRASRDSEGNSPAASLEEGSDGEVFVPGKEVDKQTDEQMDAESSCVAEKSPSDGPSHIFHKLLMKSHSVDEQKVPGSPDQDIPSPTLSPNADAGEKIGAFRKYQDHIRMQMEKRRQLEVKLECVSPKNEADHLSRDIENRRMSFDSATAPQARLTTDQGRLIDTLVASALASSAAQSIIYGRRAMSTDSRSSIMGYQPGQNLSFSTCTMKNYESEPHDLSKKTDLNGKHFGHRLYENSSDQGRLASAYREWAAMRQNKEIALERSKQYLESHRRIAGLLSERAEEAPRDERTSSHISDKENIVQAVPARYPNGLFNPVGMNTMLTNYQRYDAHARDCAGETYPVLRTEIKNEYDCESQAYEACYRGHQPHMAHHNGGSIMKLLQDQSHDMYNGEAVDRGMGKLEDGGNCMISPGGYMSAVHTMMPPAAAINQSPTSTTMDHGDRFHPALMNPHFLTDTRRLKPESTHGGTVNKLCQVCSDNASGFHYGVWSCEGCKAFFKRSIQGPVDYVCPATNTCTIDKHRRKSCQACRLRKCYEVGMNKGSQRKERKASTTQNKSPKRPRSDSNDINCNGVDSTPTPPKNSRKSRTTIIIEALSKAELPNLESYHNHNVAPTRPHLLASFVKLAEKELVFLINWAKNVPGYTELSLGDQVHLIECCWMELLLLNCSFRSMEHCGRRLVIAPDLVLERPYWSTLGMSEVLEQVAAVSEQLVQYDLHNEELLLLQATVLANAEVRKLASYGKLQEIRQNILDSLVDIAQKYHPDNLRHIPSLLLLLTHIRQAAERATSYFQSVKREGLVTFCDLLTEMLDAQSEEKRAEVSSASTTPLPNSSIDVTGKISA